MAHTDIQEAFIDGIHEVYSTMFTDGEDDGIDLYFLDMKSTKVDNVYRESKSKKYGKPIRLVSHANLSPTIQDVPIKDIEYDAVFKVPLKEFINHKIDVSPTGLDTMRKGKISFDGKDYEIKNILPTTFVRDVFLVYQFICKAK